MRRSFPKKPVSLIVFLASCLLGVPRLGAAGIIDRIVAIVNGEAITLYELYQAELPVLGRIVSGTDTASPEDKAREQEVLARLIEEKILLQRAKERGFIAQPDEVDEAIARIMQEQSMDQKMLDRALEQRGLTMAKYRDRLATQIALSKLYNSEVRLKIVVSAEEVAAYYQANADKYATPERVKIRHILVLKQGDGSSRDQAEKIRDQAVSGVDFAELARRHSQDSSQHKGEISGFIQRGDTQPELEKAIFQMSAGQISPVVETDMGFHIFKLELKEAPFNKPLAEAAAEIQAILADEKIKQRSEQWLQELKKQASVSIKL